MYKPLVNPALDGENHLKITPRSTLSSIPKELEIDVMTPSRMKLKSSIFKTSVNIPYELVID